MNIEIDHYIISLEATPFAFMSAEIAEDALARYVVCHGPDSSNKSMAVVQDIRSALQKAIIDESKFGIQCRELFIKDYELMVGNVLWAQWISPAELKLPSGFSIVEERSGRENANSFWAAIVPTLRDILPDLNGPEGNDARFIAFLKSRWWLGYCSALHSAIEAVDPSRAQRDRRFFFMRIYARDWEYYLEESKRLILGHDQQTKSGAALGRADSESLCGKPLGYIPPLLSLSNAGVSGLADCNELVTPRPDN